MILTCPACATRYLVDPHTLGARGRRVRCARCAESWYQAPPEPEPAAPAPPPIQPTHATARPLPPGSNLPALIPPRRPGPSPLAWAALALLLVAGLAAALAFREGIVRQWPPAGRLYAALGLPAARQGPGFNLRHLASERTLSQGRPVLRVSAEVVNLGPAARPAPPLHLTLKDAEARPLKEWTERLAGGPLGPGQAAAFEAELADPPAAAVSLSVRFEAEG